jgi:hypothetical protein
MIYLGDNITPSGIAIENNKYLINVKTISGGYIDGSALQSTSYSTTNDNTMHRNNENIERTQRNLDENPGACGHKINHSAIHDNVIPISFNWDDVFRSEHEKDPTIKLDNKFYYELPNIIRCDGSIRYISGSDTIRYTGDGPNCGIVFCAKDTIPNRGTELLLNYQLRQPYPDWAKDWYSTTT